MNNSHFIKRKTHNFESKHEPEDNKIHLINNVNEFKKRIDGPLIQKRKFKGFTASTLKKQIKISTNKKL